MKTDSSSARRRVLKVLLWVGVTTLAMGVIFAISVPSLLRARVSVNRSTALAREREAMMRGYPSSVVPEMNTERYDRIRENPFADANHVPLSTFAVDVDTASYANLRRFLRRGELPPKDAVRIEEMVNYFAKDYPAPEGDDPFRVTTETAVCPWQPEHRLVLIGLQGRRLPEGGRPPHNLVFLVDVSGSMQDPSKLALVKAGLRLLVDTLTEHDRVALVVYAGSAGLVLPPTAGHRKVDIREAIERLEAGGSTAGGEGILLAYRTAREMYAPDAVNRVVLATDGDFNVGITSPGALERLIEKEREGGVMLSVLGVGEGNLQDATMEMLADKGNGNYSYLDSLAEARKVLVREGGGTLVTIAKDVKVQVEVNPKRVASYRLIGYEDRLLRDEDFADDRKDGGEIGAGHSVTALYEVVPVGTSPTASAPAPLRYRDDAPLTAAADSDELLTVKLRYQPPAGGESRLLTATVRDTNDARTPSIDMQFSAAVAGFGLLLRDSEHKGRLEYGQVLSLARGALGTDPHGDRAELLELVALAARLPRG